MGRFSGLAAFSDVSVKMRRNMRPAIWMPLLALLIALLAVSRPRHAHAELVVDPTRDPKTMMNALIDKGITVIHATFEAGLPDWWTYTPFSVPPSRNSGGRGPAAVFAEGPLAMSAGLLLTNGDAGLAVPPNRALPGADAGGATGALTPDFGSASSAYTDSFCSRLFDGAQTDSHDVVKLTVDFTLDAGYDGVSLLYAFGSEEYPDYVGQTFADAFGFFVKPSGSSIFTNIALDPNSHQININGPFFSSESVMKSYGPDPEIESEYNGFTPRLRSSMRLAATGPNHIHRLVIVICDAGDQLLDSGVFLKAFSGCVNDGCESLSWCGDGKLQSGEQCDDGNIENHNDGCTAACKVVPGWACTMPLVGASVCSQTCGNGRVDPPYEQCDDGNAEDRDDCVDCRLPTCSDSIFHELGTNTEIDVDCGGACPPCGDQAKCTTHVDCDSGYCDPLLLECDHPPDTIARDDEFQALSGEVLSLTLEDILENDDTVDATTFRLLSGETTAGGEVGYDAAKQIVSYVPPPDFDEVDTFEYEVCNPYQLSNCATATVRVDVNRPPVLADRTTWLAVGTASTSLSVPNIFVDPDGDPLLVSSIVAVAPPAATVNIEPSGTVIFTPTNPLLASSYAVSLTACDNATPRGCDTATWTIIVNDPPNLTSQVIPIAAGAVVTVAQSVWFSGYGGVVGDSATDGDIDGLLPIVVSNSATGLFGSSQVLALGSCAADGLTGEVTLVAPLAQVGISTCFVRACEELPQGDARVCAVTSITMQVVECLEDSQCATGVCDPEEARCVTCRDTEPAGLDEGCTAATPVCLGDRCVTCVDDGIGPDDGCGGSTPACVVGRCVECSEDVECASGVCDAEVGVCVDCRNTAAPGQTDLGCAVATPACDEADGPTCKECLADPDCGPRACDVSTDTCVPCRNSAAGAARDRGCGGPTPICAGTGALAECVSCIDDRPVGIDSGCAIAQPVCDVPASGSPSCVVCKVDIDCPDQRVCDAMAACVPCIDTAPNAQRDRGCTVGAPICSAGVDGRGCVPCVDDRGPQSVDSGCSAALPACMDDAPGGPTCVRCEVDADCGSGLCVDGSCRACRDTSETGLDAGCNVARPVCDERNVPNCTTCIDSAPPGLVDVGCDGGRPACVETAAIPYCGRCAFDGDCAGGEVCVVELDRCVSRDALLAVPDHYHINQGDPLSVPRDLGLMHNDVVPTGFEAVVSIAAGTAPDPTSEGVLTVAQDGALGFIPNAAFHGALGFEYQLSSAALEPSTARVAIRVNGRPVAEDDRATTRPEGPVRIAVLDNDLDPEDESLEIVATTTPFYGTVRIELGGVTYTPPASFSGEDRFEYTVCDADEACDTALVVVTVGEAQKAPAGRDDFALTQEDVAVLIAVGANDELSYTVSAIERAARHGETEVVDGRVIRYVPRLNWSGYDNFAYLTCDGAVCIALEVSVVVLPVNDPPVPLEDTIVTRVDAAVLAAVLANDLDPDGDAIGLPLIERQPAHGAVEVLSDGRLKYTPRSGFTGRDDLAYRACDSLGSCAPAEVDILVVQENAGSQAPVVADDRAEVDGLGSIDVYVLDNDIDPDVEPLFVRQSCDPRHGHAEILSSSRIRYRPDVDFEGADTFCYVACDGGGLCATAQVTVDVNEAANASPAAIDDVVSTPKGTPVSLEPTRNDSDPDGDVLVLWRATDPPVGAVASAGIAVTYTPPGDFEGLVWFPVTVSDGRGGMAESNVFVHVLPAANAPPEAVDDLKTASLAAPTGLEVRANDRDPDGDPIAVAWATAARSETVSADLGAVKFVDGDLVFTPGADLSALALAASPLRFDYEIIDNLGGTARAEVVITFADRDRDGLPDDTEIADGTDPDDADSDDDGLSDGEEVARGDAQHYEAGAETNPLDADTDDDGLEDGAEVKGLEGLAGRMTDPLVWDSDEDLLGDGLEVGVVTPVPGGVSAESVPYVGTALERWEPDADPDTVTDPLDDDSDDDGRLDGHEDEDGNGRFDGTLGATGTRGDGETNPLATDTDGDGLRDGTEVGLIGPEGLHTNPAVFVPDRDPITTTDPRDVDTDDGSVSDGAEDVNLDGAIDPGERDPNFGGDDVADSRDDYFLSGAPTCGGGLATTLGLALFVILALGRRRRA